VVAVEEVLSRWERCPERSGGRKGDSLSLPDRQLPPPNLPARAGTASAPGACSPPHRPTCHDAACFG